MGFMEPLTGAISEVAFIGIIQLIVLFVAIRRLKRIRPAAAMPQSTATAKV